MIQTLKIEDNNLRTLANIEKLERLQALHASGNRLAEFWEVDRFSELNFLMELSLFNNPMTRKPQYRQNITRKLTNLLVLDGKEVLPEERMVIDPNGQFQTQKIAPMIHYQPFQQQKMQVKLNSVNFDGVFNNQKFQSDNTPGIQLDQKRSLGGV